MYATVLVAVAAAAAAATEDPPMTDCICCSGERRGAGGISMRGAGNQLSRCRERMMDMGTSWTSMILLVKKGEICGVASSCSVTPRILVEIFIESQIH